ncbi:MAG: flagellar basal-body rod protein FlgF [Gammaproteobacteria bacterium]
MDRMLYLAMSGAKQTMNAQAIATNNLANVNTTGFKADLAAARSMPVFGDGHASRVYAMTERPGIDYGQGSAQYTGNDLDFAINGNGFIAVQSADGSEAYTRRGDMKLNASGLLENGAGQLILGDGGPIALPPAESLQIGVDGIISIRPLGQGANTSAQVDRIKLVNPQLSDLQKGADGLFRMKDGSQTQADAIVRVIPGSLEASNVSAVGEMVNMINLQRQFEMQIKAMKSVEENDSASAQMMRVS